LGRLIETHAGAGQTHRAIVRLGAPSTVVGFDIDTSNFNGNEGPEARVYGMVLGRGEEEGKIRKDDARVSFGRMVVRWRGGVVAWRGG
jgi:allantoicase